MAQSFLALPSGNPGAAVAVPVSEVLKTFYVGGSFDAEQVVLEVSPDGTVFTVAGSIPLESFEPVPVSFSAAFARVRVIGLTQGSPVCFLALNTISGSLTTVALPVPPVPGTGAAVATDALPRKKSFYVMASGAGASQGVIATVEASMDGTNFNPLFRIEGRLSSLADIVPVEGFFAFARVRLLSGSGIGLQVFAAADPSCC